VRALQNDSWPALASLLAHCRRVLADPLAELCKLLDLLPKLP
jgi:hypothetical protein